MPRISLWTGRKNADYKYIDRIISEFFNASGTALYVHLYLGVHDQTDPALGAPTKPSNVTDIQDVLFLENRDRKYSDAVYELRGTMQVQDADFDLKQFGLFLGAGSTFIEMHLNDMLAIIGRKLMPGDVIELPHERDDALLDGGKAINQFYVVDDSSRASDGYSATWFPHIWRVRLTPMTNAQEYSDILDAASTDPFGLQTGDKLGDLLGTVAKDMAINEAVVDEAIEYVKARNFDTRQFYVINDGTDERQSPWIFAGDGVPPNGAVPVGSGNVFPTANTVGDYYLRTDYSPNTLFRYDGNVWQMQEVDYRQGSWSAASRLMTEFLNNTATTTFDDGDVADQKIALSKAVKPKADF